MAGCELQVETPLLIHAAEAISGAADTWYDAAKYRESLIFSDRAWGGSVSGQEARRVAQTRCLQLITAVTALAIATERTADLVRQAAATFASAEALCATGVDSLS